MRCVGWVGWVGGGACTYVMLPPFLAPPPGVVLSVGLLVLAKGSFCWPGAGLLGAMVA